MFRVVVFISFILGALILGDLKNWRKYYSTILFTIICSLYYDVLYRDNPLWRLEPLPPLENILFNSTLLSLALAFAVLIPTTLIYLSNYPLGKKQFPYIILWIFIYALIEAIMFKNKAISYHNGWSFMWSVFFDVVLFSLVRIHYLYPSKAWVLSGLFSIFIWTIFGFPMKP